MELISFRLSRVRICLIPTYTTRKITMNVSFDRIFGFLGCITAYQALNFIKEDKNDEL